MNKCLLKNMKLFKLVEYNHSYRKIIKLVKELGNREASEDLIYEILGDTSSVRSIIGDLNIVYNSNHYSLWCLSYYGVNSFTIERLKNEFDDLNILSTRINDLSSLGVHKTTLNKILRGINDLKLNRKSQLEQEIMKIIEANEPITNCDLKTIIFNKYFDVDSNMFDSLIDSMLSRRLITNNISGYKICHFDLDTYLMQSSNEIDNIIYDCCNGKTFETCGQDKGLTGKKVRQKVENRIQRLPIFDNEKEYLQLQKKYKFMKEDIIILKMDLILWKYVNLKYGTESPEKDVIDYLKENNLCDTEIGEKVFYNHELIIIDNEIVKNDFIDIFIRFIHKQKFSSFKIYDIIENFNMFLKNNNISNKNYYIEKDNLSVICRKLENSGKFLNVGSKKFIYFEEDALSSDFVELMKQYLLNFEGYGSVLLFLENNRKLCNSNRISNENELFVIMKRLFSKEFKDKIEFIRNPTLSKKGVNKEIFIENLLLDLDLPCEVEVYLNYIRQITGLKQTSVASNFCNIINKYKNVDGLLSLDSEYSHEEEKKFKELLGDRECIGMNMFDFQVRKVFGNEDTRFLNSNIIKKFGYCKTNTSIYKDCYQSRLDAVRTILKQQDIILDDVKINQFTNLEFLINRQYDALKECLVIKIEDNKYLNIVARNEQDCIKQLKFDLLNLLDDEQIYELNEFLDSDLFKKLIHDGNEYKNILYSFDTKEILKFIFSTTDGFSYLSQGDTFLVSKGIITYDLLVNRIMQEYEILSIGEFKEIFYEKYGITKSFSNTDLSNMGYYCPYTSEKVYLSKEYYEYEMEEYLNGNS